MADQQPYPDDLDAAGENPRDVRVGELLNEYFDLQRSGSSITADEFLSRHAEYADELRRHFASLGLIDRIVRSGQGDGTVALTASREVAPRGSGGSRGDGGGASLLQIDGYEVLREIGRGGMGLVYKALQKSTKRVVAVKVLLEAQLASDAARRRFEREIALSAQLRHPNIIPIYDSGETGGRMFYAMEYVHGVPLGQYIHDRGVSLKDRLRLLAKICHAVSHAHQRGVIHRDLKPSNVLVDNDGEPHIHDFGLAKSGSMVDVNLSVTTNLVGTPAYMSPEQVAGDPGGIDTRTDVYSLGVMLYEMVTGRMPYEVTPNIQQTLNNITHAEPQRPSKVGKGIDSDLETIILKALAKAKEERYQSAGELAADLERFVRGDPIQARPSTMLYLLRKAVARHRYQAIVVGLTFLIAVSMLLMSRISHDRTQLKQQLHQEEQVSTAQLQLMQQFLKEGAERFGNRFQDYVQDVVTDMSKKQPVQAVIAKKFMELSADLSRSLAASQPGDGVDLDAEDATSAQAARPEKMVPLMGLQVPQSILNEIMQELAKIPKSDQAAALTVISAKLMEYAARVNQQASSRPTGSATASAAASEPSAGRYE